MSVEKKFFLLLLFSSIWKLAYLSLPNLAPQEAYYWSWSKFLDWSYFDHPPLATYCIALFTRIFGDSIFGIRFAVWIFSILDALLLYKISKKLTNTARPALWALVFLNLSPLFLIGSVIITPDVPMIFFWALTVYLFLLALEKGSWQYWILTGISLGFGILSKYSAILLLPCALLFLALSPKDRPWLKRPHPYLALLPALFVFAPVLIWNWKHDWVSIRFQSSSRVAGMIELQPDRFFQFIAGQAGSLNPILFGCFIFALVFLTFRGRLANDRRYAFLWSFSIVPFLVCIAMSWLSFVKMNWPAPAYVTGLLLFSLLFQERERSGSGRFWPRAAGTLGIVFCLTAYALPVIPLLPLRSGDTWTGWPELGQKISEIREDMEKQNSVFVFGNEYKVSAEMWFYNRDKTRTYSRNILGQPALQFDYFPFSDSLAGKDAIFAWCDFEPFGDLALLQKHFARIEKNGPLEIRKRGKLFRTFEIYRCYGYKGRKNA